MSVSSKARLLALALLASAAPLFPAHAYDWLTTGSQMNDQSFFDSLTNTRRWDVTLGVGGGYAPRYEGSDRYEMAILPYFDFSFDKRLIFFNMKGIGVTPLQGRDYHVGASLGYDLGRFESDDRKNLRGLNKVDASMLGNLFADYSYGPLTAALDTKSALFGDYGNTVGLRLGGKHALGQSWMLNADGHTIWADTEHMRNFFGVTPAQSVASGKPYYDPDSGFKSFGFTVGATYAITPSWALRSTIKTDWLVGQAEKSPVSVDSFQSTGNLMATYSF